MSARRASIAAFALALSLAAPAARAQSAADVAAARDLFIEGSQLSQKGDWEGARKKYERSLKLKRAAITLYTLGLAEQNTGHVVEALEHFKAFLAEPSAPATKPYEKTAQDALPVLEKKVARLTLKIEPANVDVSVAIDGEAVPAEALDRPRLVNPGAHVVTATAKGYKPAEAKTAALTEGGSGSVTLKLELAPADAPAPLAPVVAPLPAQPPAGPKPDRTIPIILLGGGGALLAGGVIIGMVGLSQAGSAPTKDGPEASSARTKGVVGDVLGGVGIAAAAVGAVLLVIGKPTKKEPGASSGFVTRVAPRSF